MIIKKNPAKFPGWRIVEMTQEMSLDEWRTLRKGGTITVPTPIGEAFIENGWCLEAQVLDGPKQVSCGIAELNAPDIGTET